MIYLTHHQLPYPSQPVPLLDAVIHTGEDPTIADGGGSQPSLSGALPPDASPTCG